MRRWFNYCNPSATRYLFHEHFTLSSSTNEMYRLDETRKCRITPVDSGASSSPEFANKALHNSRGHSSTYIESSSKPRAVIINAESGLSRERHEARRSGNPSFCARDKPRGSIRVDPVWWARWAPDAVASYAVAEFLAFVWKIKCPRDIPVLAVYSFDKPFHVDTAVSARVNREQSSAGSETSATGTNSIVCLFSKSRGFKFIKLNFEFATLYPTRMTHLLRAVCLPDGLTSLDSISTGHVECS